MDLHFRWGISCFVYCLSLDEGNLFSHTMTILPAKSQPIPFEGKAGILRVSSRLMAREIGARQPCPHSALCSMSFGVALVLCADFRFQSCMAVLELCFHQSRDPEFSSLKYLLVGL